PPPLLAPPQPAIVRVKRASASPPAARPRARRIESKSWRVPVSIPISPFASRTAHYSTPAQTDHDDYRAVEPPLGLWLRGARHSLDLGREQHLAAAQDQPVPGRADD